MERKVGINWINSFSNETTPSGGGGVTNLFLGEPGIQIYNVHDVPLDNTDVGKMSSPQRVQVLALSVSLFLLLGEALVATKSVSDSLGMRGGTHVLLRFDWLELNSFICVLSPACGTSPIEVFFDVMPTETTDLSGDLKLAISQG